MDRQTEAGNYKNQCYKNTKWVGCLRMDKQGTSQEVNLSN